MSPRICWDASKFLDPNALCATLHSQVGAGDQEHDHQSAIRLDIFRVEPGGRGWGGDDDAQR